MRHKLVRKMYEFIQNLLGKMANVLLVLVALILTISFTPKITVCYETLIFDYYDIVKFKTKGEIGKKVSIHLKIMPNIEPFYGVDTKYNICHKGG